MKERPLCNIMECFSKTFHGAERPLHFEHMTGLDKNQLDELVALVHDRIGSWWCRPGMCLGLYRSVALVVFLLRENPTQAAAGGIFGISQPTVVPALGGPARDYRGGPRRLGARARRGGP